MALEYFFTIGIVLCANIILAIGFNIAAGYTGMLNLGQVALFGVGAYTTAILATNSVNPVIGAIVGVATAALAGLLLSLPTARLKQDYFAIATLAFVILMLSLARNWTGLTRGVFGIPKVPPLMSGLLETFLLGTVLVVITFLLAWRLVSSKTGKVFEAIRDDEIAAQSLGYDTFKYKMMVMGISGAIAGVAGVYYVHFLRFVDPSFFALPEVIFAVAILIIGGLGSLLGSVLGASVVVIAYETIKYLPLPLEVLGAFRIILFGLIVLLVLLLRPKGIAWRIDL